MDFKSLMGKEISILMTGRFNKKETYSGTVADVTDSYLVLQFHECKDPSVKNPLDQVLIRFDIIESLWIFKEPSY